MLAIARKHLDSKHPCSMQGDAVRTLMDEVFYKVPSTLAL